MFQKRVDQVIARMKADGLKQILVSEPCSIYYLTGVDVGPGERLFALYLNDEGRKELLKRADELLSLGYIKGADAKMA